MDDLLSDNEIGTASSPAPSDAGSGSDFPLPPPFTKQLYQLANPEKTKDDLKSYVLRFFTLNMALALIMSWVKWHRCEMEVETRKAYANNPNRQGPDVTRSGDFLFNTAMFINIVMVVRTVLFIRRGGNNETHLKTMCLTKPFLTILFLLYTHSVVYAGHDYLMVVLVFSLDLFSTHLTAFNKFAISFAMVTLAQYLVRNDLSRELYCGYAILDPASSHVNAPASALMTLCSSNPSRYSTIWLVFCSYLICTLSEWQKYGFTSDNGNIPIRMLLKYMAKVEKNYWEKDTPMSSVSSNNSENSGIESFSSKHSPVTTELELSPDSSVTSPSTPSSSASSSSSNPPRKSPTSFSYSERRERRSTPSTDLKAFENYSSSGYNPEEDRKLKELLSLIHFSGLTDTEGNGNMLRNGSTYAESYNISIDGQIAPSEKSGVMAGKNMGIVGAPMSQICAWCWNFCSKERTEYNAKVDVRREIISLDSEHGMTIFKQKFFPPPHVNRNFLLRQVWKRADNDTMFIYMYDDKSSIFNENLYHTSTDGRKTIRASLRSILVLQQETGSSASQAITTQVTQLCAIDLNGKMDDSLTLGSLKSCMNTILELQTFFPPLDPKQVPNSMRKDSYDEEQSDSFNRSTSSNILNNDIDVLGFQKLIKEAKKAEQQPLILASETSSSEGEESPDLSSVKPQDGKSRRSRHDKSRFEDDEESGGFIFWLIKNHKGVLTDDGDIGDDKTFEMEDFRDLRIFFRNAEFKDQEIEKNFLEYFGITQMRILTINALSLCVISFCFTIGTIISFASADQDYSLGNEIIMTVLRSLIGVVAFSLYRSVGKDGKFNMLSIHLISGLVFGLTLRSDGLIQQEFFLDKSSGDFHVVIIYIFLWIAFLMFINFAALIEARVAKPHLLLHSLLIFSRLSVMLDSKQRNYTYALHRIMFPFCLICTCIIYTHVQERLLRKAFIILWKNFHEEFNYRVGRFNAAYNQQQMEDIQIASNQFHEGYLGKDIIFEELEFQKQIGQGTSCTVHMALYRNKIVAVRQLIMGQINRYSAVNFVSEMRLLSKLSHPNVIRLYGVVQFNSTSHTHLSMVLEYASEGSVADYLRMHESVDWQGYKRDIALGISAGMNYLHTQSEPILHRDLKTSNCLVTEWSEVKVCDFGAACLLSKDAPETNEVIGSKYHMSPEMLSGDKYDQKTDIFAFGSLLADIGMGGNLQRLFTNRPNGPKAFDFNEFIIQGWRPPLPNAWMVEMPVIADLIGRCWRKEPSERPTFREIKSILRNWSGKLTRKLSDSAVLRATTEYTEDESLFFRQQLSLNENLNEPPDNFRKNKHNEFLLQRNWEHVVNPKSKHNQKWIIHQEKTLSYPSWEVLDYIIDWENPERIQQGRTTGLVDLKVLQIENEHSKIVTVKDIDQHKPFVLVSKMLWKEVDKDYFFLVNKAVSNPEAFVKEKEPGTSFINMHDIMTVQGSPDGESCHVTLNRTNFDPPLKPSTIQNMTKTIPKLFNAIDTVLKKRTLQKIVEMQKLGERAQRYNRQNSYVDLENYEVSTEADSAVGNKTLDSDQPWISSKAMDQDYRKWKTRNRVMTGGGEKASIQQHSIVVKDQKNSMDIISEADE